jgi:hypothetical protein
MMGVGQLVQIPRGLDVQPQSLRERLNNLSRRILVAAHLQAQVVLRADARQHRQLLAPQTRNAPARAGNQPDLLGMHLLAPRTQIITQCVGLDRHLWDLFPWERAGGRGRQSSQLLERSGGVAAGLGAIHHHVVPTGIRSVEPVPVQI